MMQSQRKRHVAAVVGGVLPEMMAAKMTAMSPARPNHPMASGDPAPDAAADTASPDGDAAVKESKSAGKPTRKKAAKKPAKKSAVSDENGSDGDESGKSKCQKTSPWPQAKGQKPDRCRWRRI